MSEDQAEQSAPEHSDLETTVADYLRRHPNFFEQHPDVLATLQIPHPTGGAVSLIEYQVRLLRKQLDTERHRLTHLISRAREYEALSARVHDLVLKLISVQDPEHLRSLLREALVREFNADAVTLKLFAMTVPEEGETDPLTAAFHGFLDRKHALCGPLDPEKGRVLFGENGIRVQAAALVPIRADHQSGVLAIGSTNPKRFHPDMATDLLDRLGEIISHKLRVVPLGRGE